VTVEVGLHRLLGGLGVRQKIVDLVLFTKFGFKNTFFRKC